MAFFSEYFWINYFLSPKPEDACEGPTRWLWRGQAIYAFAGVPTSSRSGQPGTPLSLKAGFKTVKE